VCRKRDWPSVFKSKRADTREGQASAATTQDFTMCNTLRLLDRAALALINILVVAGLPLAVASVFVGGV
jgi:hypothetical protein